MKITGKKSVSSIVKKFLIILFIGCLIAMVTIPILMKNLNYDPICDHTGVDVVVEMFFMYIAAIPALLMIVEFEKIFSDFEKEKVFNRKNEKRIKRSSIYCLVIGIIFLVNVLVYNFLISGEMFRTPFRMMYLIIIILMAMIFLILSIGLMILKNIYRTAVDNKEENDLTI